MFKFIITRNLVEPFFIIIAFIMVLKPNKRAYKVISLLIKTVILIVSFCYIWQKISIAGHTIGFFGLLHNPNKNYLFAVCLLLFVNWGLEAMKWQLLISKFENITFLQSMASVFSGVTISIFTPNRVGEFAGRIFYLRKADKLQATISSMIGSSFQLLITVLAGILAYFILQNNYNDFFQTSQFISTNAALGLIFCAVLFVGVLVFIYLKRNKQFAKYKKYIEVLSMYSLSELLVVGGLSLFRYAVFSFQYYLVLKLFGVNAGTTIFFSLIALTFFVTSVIPTFALTEIAVRGATAVYFFGTLYPDSTAIVAASLLLWIINLGVPALAGGIFIWKLKFFKE